MTIEGTYMPAFEQDVSTCQKPINSSVTYRYFDAKGDHGEDCFDD